MSPRYVRPVPHSSESLCIANRLGRSHEGIIISALLCFNLLHTLCFHMLVRILVQYSWSPTVPRGTGKPLFCLRYDARDHSAFRDAALAQSFERGGGVSALRRAVESGTVAAALAAETQNIGAFEAYGVVWRIHLPLSL